MNEIDRLKNKLIKARNENNELKRTIKQMRKQILEQTTILQIKIRDIMSTKN